MKVISLPETAFEVLTAANGTMTFAELYGKVAEIAEMSEEEKAARIGQFYTDISLDGRFVGLTDNTWDLRSRHTYDKVHIDVNDVYSEVDEGERDAEDAPSSAIAMKKKPSSMMAKPRPRARKAKKLPSLLAWAKKALIINF